MRPYRWNGPPRSSRVRRGVRLTQPDNRSRASKDVRVASLASPKCRRRPSQASVSRTAAPCTSPRGGQHLPEIRGDREHVRVIRGQQPAIAYEGRLELGLRLCPAAAPEVGLAELLVHPVARLHVVTPPPADLRLHPEHGLLRPGELAPLHQELRQRHLGLQRQEAVRAGHRPADGEGLAMQGFRVL